jgi:predicted secreted protein with PEFG-CTERM motif
VEIKIFYTLISLLIISTGTVFAQESLINIQTDASHYVEGDIVVVSGSVFPVLPSTPIVLQLFLEESLIVIAQITVAQDGSFSHIITADGPLWKKQGDYLVRASYEASGGIIAEVEFSYSPKSDSIETKDNFEVNAGSSGTFDVEYSIRGGTVKDMVVDQDIFGITIQIESTDKGTISLDLPRDFIGAEKQNGKDEKFIILIKNIENPDGVYVDYEESVLHSDSRVITINFEEGDSDIEIIGTYVVPEFGTIVMMILIAGIMTVILASRNKFQIKV